MAMYAQDGIGDEKFDGGEFSVPEEVLLLAVVVLLLRVVVLLVTLLPVLVVPVTVAL